ncbi:MAG: replication factor C small subunit, partial [Nanoarchaeota archaeon]|nr:replication factor C small subunit [Nanoarchaeota archaeon]
YRPKTLNEVINQRHIVERLKAWVKEKTIPNMLFAGAPGVGKTTIALCLAHELFGEHWRENFQETNASVTPETPIMIRERGKIKRTNFSYLEKNYFKGKEKYARSKNLEILSTGNDYKTRFKKVSLISRHKVNKIAEIKYEGGVIRTSLNHSIMVIDDKGKMVSKQAADLRNGDLLITFCESLDHKNPNIEFSRYKPNDIVSFQHAQFRNPKIKSIIGDKTLNEDTSWLFGLYLAEGCAHIRESGTNGCTILTVSSNEMEKAKHAQYIIKNEFNLDASVKPAASGFDRSRMSSLQIRTYNTQLAKFFLDNFYNDSGIKNARSKNMPSFIFNSNLACREAFLKGYMGDACGEWKGFLRYSSKSKENLIDVSWLGRLMGIDTSVFNEEARMVWKLPSYSYIKTDFIPAEPLLKILKETKIEGKNKYRVLLRHQLYHKKSKRLSKKLAIKVLEGLSNEVNDRRIDRLIKFANSSLSVVKIKSIRKKKYNSYVYDVSVPGSEMFWGGTSPILLHNSDERGIDVVRGRIKEFAKIRPLGSSFKIIFLDESDALTPEAQQALRRTMERFSGVCRFILSANYSSRLIEPIQSRTAVFRFKELDDESVTEYVNRLVEGESIKISKDGIETIVAVSKGDLRLATNILQSAAVTGKEVNKESVYDIVSKAKPEDVNDMISLAIKGNFVDARKKLYELLITQGLSGEDIIREIHKQVFDLDITEERKLNMIEKIGEFEFRLNQGGTPEIQLQALLAQFLKK